MKINQKLLGQAVKEIRKIRGLTQAQLARSAGLSEGGNSVALIERGQRGVSMDSLNALASALDVPAACITILATPTPTHDPDLKRMLAIAQRLVTKTVELHTVLSKEAAMEKKSKPLQKKKASASRPESRSSRKRPSAA